MRAAALARALSVEARGAKALTVEVWMGRPQAAMAGVIRALLTEGGALKLYVVVAMSEVEVREVRHQASSGWAGSK